MNESETPLEKLKNLNDLYSEFSKSGLFERNRSDKLIRILTIYISIFSIIIGLSYWTLTCLPFSKNNAVEMVVKAPVGSIPPNSSDTIVRKDFLIMLSETIQHLRDTIALNSWLTSSDSRSNLLSIKEGHQFEDTWKITIVSSGKVITLKSGVVKFTVKDLGLGKIKLGVNDMSTKLNYDTLLSIGYSYIPIHEKIGIIFRVVEVDNASKSVKLYAKIPNESDSLILKILRKP